MSCRFWKKSCTPFTETSKKVLSEILRIETDLFLILGDVTFLGDEDEFEEILNLEGTQFDRTKKFRGTKLIKLDLSSRQLGSLPDSIGQFTFLERLDLSGNQLKTLPEGFGELINLKMLNIHTNKILEMLPSTFRNLTKLETLEASYNSFTSLPSLIGDLKSLQTLSISHNKLDLLNLSEDIYVYLR